MSEFDAMMMAVWFASLVIAGAAGMTALLRLALTALLLFRVASNLMAALSWGRVLRHITDRLPTGAATKLELKPCD